MMLKKCSMSVLFVLFLLFMTIPLFAQNNPFQIALVTPVQLVPEDDSVSGIRLNLIYGRNTTITGLDLGLINHTTSGVSEGVQFGFVGLVDSDFRGWQDNTVNITRGDFEGFQWGFYNYAKYVNGFQLGIVNYAGSMKGLQIGLVNIIKKGGSFPFFPIINWSF